MTFTMEDEARTLRVFHIHPETRELTGESDVYIPPHTGLPAGCTTTEPPHIPEGFAALFDEVRQRWELAEDHRGKVVWETTSGDEITITEIGPLPENTTTAAPSSAAEKFTDGEWVEDRSLAISIKNNEINEWRNTMEAANYVFTFNGRNWDYGKETQSRLAPSVAAAKSGLLPAEFFWTDADNNDIPVTADELIALSNAASAAMFTKGMEIHIRQREMKKAIEELQDPAEIMAYPVGWKTDTGDGDDE
ncbi:DUF4376 domain-containing protein [Escherichia coli]|uniref:DUF4376 domain-containing protein n=1 Tax=Escherichia coli TaxID=562 RepID=UPI0010AC576F|nr:DUF4376 domain-containing protein [Escherichia coli]EHD7191587.1 DUF4376 domain-containing protein [Escherichia coli]EHL6538953.1 DUF4376 domain-containing protein [Escherichia coli]TJE92244.1 DUF4376 domain-containing protein [Escherichia coli]